MGDEINGWQSHPPGVSEFQGSQTLPRNLGGSKTKTKKTNRAKDDSDITKELHPTSKTGKNGGVRIRIVNGSIIDSKTTNETSDVLINNIRNRALNIKDEDAEYASVRGNENYIDNQQPPITNRISSNGNATNCKESQTSLDFDSSCYTTLNQNRNINEKHSNSNQEKSVDNSNPKRRASNQRNLTLEELELEEFDCHNNQSLIVNPVDFGHSNNILLGKEMENLIDSDASEDDIVSLNSLIEGDVDELSDSDANEQTKEIEFHPSKHKMEIDDLLGEDEELAALTKSTMPLGETLDNSDTEA